MKMLVGLFSNVTEADQAVGALMEAGIDRTDIGVLTRSMQTGEGEGDLSAEQVAGSAAMGAAGGGAVGGILGLLAGLGAIAIPGLGPVIAAGSLLSILGLAGGGAAVGAAVGGLVGGMTGLGVKEEEAHVYAEGVRRGGVLITVAAPDDLAATAARLLKENGAQDIDLMRREWEEEGWKQFDPRSDPDSETSFWRKTQS